MIGVLRDIPIVAGEAKGRTFKGPPTRIRDGKTTYRLVFRDGGLAYVPESVLRAQQQRAKSASA